MTAPLYAFGGAEGAVAAKGRQYAARGVTLSAQEAMDEIAADFTREMLYHIELFRDLVRQDRSLAKWVMDGLTDFIRRVKNAFSGQTAREGAAGNEYGATLSALEEAALLWQAAYDAAAEAVQNAQKNTAAQTDDGARLSLKSKNPYDGKALASDSVIYSYDFLTSLPDMQVTMLPEVDSVRDAGGKVDTSKVVETGIKNARNVGAERDSKAFVQNGYTGKQLLVTTNSIRHGLNGGMNRLLTNARLGVVIGDVVKNAVPINALHNKAKGVTGTYAMAAYATDNQGREFVAIVTVEQKNGLVTTVEAFDTLHAVSGRQKRGQASDPHTRSRASALSNLSKISIEDLLEVVNTTHQSILSDDVLAHLGETRNPDGEYTGQVKFSLKTPVEYKSGDDANRPKVNSMEDARFSLKSTDSEGRQLSAAQRELDMDRIRDAAESSGFGESGKRALTAAYDGEPDAAAYFAGFSVLYHAGLTGVEKGKVKSPYISPLTPAQRYAAYTAGQNDAAAARSERLQDARVDGTIKGRQYSVKGDDNGQKAGTDRDGVSLFGLGERATGKGGEAAAPRRKSGPTRAGVRGGQLSFGSRSQAERERLTEILIIPVDNAPLRRALMIGSRLDDAAELPSNAIDRDSPSIHDMMRHIPGFAKAGADARAYANRGRTVRGTSVGPAVKNATGKDSAGRALSQRQRAYFAGSRARDAQGNLLRLFHGSRTDVFTEFDLYEGVWLTGDKDYAQRYAQLRRGVSELEDQIYSDESFRMFEVYANITRPVDIGEINGPLTEEKVRELARSLGTPYAQLQGIASHYMGENTYAMTRSSGFMDLAGRLGFDGMKATEDGVETWCAIASPDQVKLTSNTDPTVSGDVRYSLKNADGDGRLAQARPLAQMPPERTPFRRELDMDRIRDAAESAGFGQSGKRALTAAYDGEADAAAYFAGFSVLYHAGLTGVEEGKVKSQYISPLTPAQRYAAYTAGQNDAADSLRAELARAPEATVYGAEAGFIENEYSAALPKKTARFYDAMGKATGTRIMMAAPTGEGGPDGWYENGIVYIASDAGKAGTVVVKHEITHHMQEVAPEQYRAYRNYAMRMLTGSDGSVSSLVEQYRARYTESGVNLTAEQAMDEIASDFTMELLLRPDRFTELAREDRSAAGKLLEAIKDFIAKVKAFFRGDKTAQDSAVAETYGVDLATLEEAARLWDNAYDAVVADVQRRKSEGQEAKTQKNATQEGGGARLSIKRTSKMTLAAQLKMYYDGKMASSDAFYFGHTPEILGRSGLDSLPLAMTISDFRKSTQTKHNIPRRVLKNLLYNLETAQFAFANGDRIGILTTDIDGDGKPLLVAIQKNVQMDSDKVNAIRSLYGLDNPASWVRNQIDDGKTFILLDEQKANTTLYPYGYMASRKDGIRSLDGTVTQSGAKSKPKFSMKKPDVNGRFSLKSTDSEGRQLSAAQRELDVGRIKDASESAGFGQSGKRALTAAYDGEPEAAAYFAGFSVLYHAGLTGVEEGKVKSPYISPLTPAQRYAAYTAGQNDAPAARSERLQDARADGTIKGKQYSVKRDDSRQKAGTDRDAGRPAAAGIRPGGESGIHQRGSVRASAGGVSRFAEFDADGNPVYATNREEADVEAYDHLALRRARAEADQKYGITPEEGCSLAGYTQTTFAIMNKKMLDGTVDPVKDQPVVDRVLSALKKFPSFEGKTYRNMEFKTEEQYNDFLEKHAAGKTVPLKSFTSTSKRPNGYPLFGDRVVHMVIDGETGADIADTYGIPRQQEVILLPGTEIEITSVTTASDGHPLIIAQEVATHGVETDHGDARPAQGLAGNRREDRDGRPGPGGDGEQSGAVRKSTRNYDGRDGVLSERRKSDQALTTEETSEPSTTEEQIAQKDELGDQALPRQGGGIPEAAQARPLAQRPPERTAFRRELDVGRIKDAAESSGFGESGKRALTAAYDGEPEAAAYFAGFSVLYHAGLTGVEEGKVKSPYISPLTPAQRYAAYTAGQNDAAAARSERLQDARVDGTRGKTKYSRRRSRTMAAQGKKQEKRLSEDAWKKAIDTWRSQTKDMPFDEFQTPLRADILEKLHRKPKKPGEN